MSPGRVSSSARCARTSKTSFHSRPGLVPALREHRRVGTPGRALHRHRRPAQSVPDVGRTGWALAGDAGPPQRPIAPAWACPTPSWPPSCWPTPSTTAWPGTSPWTRPWPATRTERDQLTANGFELTLATARLAPLPARLEALYRAAAEQPELVSRIFGVLGGSIPMADVYSATQIRAALTQRRTPGSST